MPFIWLGVTVVFVAAFAGLWVARRQHGWIFLLLGAATVLNNASRLPGAAHIPEAARTASAIAAPALLIAAGVVILAMRWTRRDAPR